MVTRSEPVRRAMVAQSMAVFPAPITTTARPAGRLSILSLLCSMYSRPSMMCSSPGMPRPGEPPSPTARNTASNRSSSQSGETSRPASMPSSIFTPIRAIISTSASATGTGSRSAMIPYVDRPPQRLRLSKIVTAWPRRRSSPAHDNPAGPAPTTAMRRPVGCAGGNTSTRLA